MIKKPKLTKKNWIQLVAMTVIFVIVAFLVYKTTITVRMVLPKMVTLIKEDKNCYYEIKSGDHLEQEMVYGLDHLLCVGTKISINDSVRKDLVVNQDERDLGLVHIKVLDEAKTPIMQADYEVYLLEDGQNLLASFPQKQAGWKDKKLTLVIDTENINDKVELKVGYNRNTNSRYSLSIGGEVFDGNLNLQIATHQFLYWKQWSMIGAALIYLMLLGSYFGLAVFRLKPEQVFLFAGAILAVIYLFLIPPATVPDEEDHIEEAYYYSNLLMGKEQEKGTTIGSPVNLDKEDYDALQEFLPTPSLSEYDSLRDQIASPRETKEGTKQGARFFTRAPWLIYSPSILGLTLGRVLGLNGLLVIYMGRIFSILFYLFMMYWAIRIMPFGKPAMFLMAILPMTIQQCCSYSYDSVIIEVTFLYFAVLFTLLYQDKPIKKWQIPVYMACMAVLAISKGGTYMSLCLLTVLIPIVRFSSKKRKWIFVGGMAATAIAAFLSSTLSYFLYVTAPTAEQQAESYLGAEAYGLAGILADPMNFVYLSVRTFFLSGDGFLENMLGMQLGWMNITVSRIVIYGMLFMMILSVLKVESDEKQREITVTPLHKICFLGVSAISVGMVFASMYASWTSFNATEIAGIQGRYFLPLLPIWLLLFRGENVTVKKDMGRKVMFLGICFQCVAIYGILLSLERIL